MNKYETGLQASLDAAFIKVKKLYEAHAPAEEFGRDVDLKNWNVVQGLLWKGVCAAEGWDINDGQRFQAFGKFFYDYWEAHHAVPDVEDVVAVLGEPHGDTDRQVVLIDMDGTINEFDEHFEVWVRKFGYGFNWDAFTTWSIEKAIVGLPTHAQQKQLFELILNDPSFWHGIPVRPEAQAVLSKWHRDPRYHLRICTNPWGTEQIYKDVKTEWLARFFPYFKAEDIVFSGKEKWLIPGDIIVDDKPEVLERCAGLKVTVKSSRPYNTDVKADYAFTHWGQMDGILGELARG